MNFFRRAWINLKRQPLKTGILLVSLLLLNSVMAGVLLVNQAIDIAEVNLRRQIPALAMIQSDGRGILEYIELTGDWPFLERLTPEVIETIGSLPYVQEFDYVMLMHDFYSTELNLTQDPTPYLGLSIPEEIISENLQNLRLGVSGLESFTLKGVYNPNVLDISKGLIELTQGRSFSFEEVQNSVTVAIISQAFATENALNIGDSFVLELREYDWSDFWNTSNIEDMFSDDLIILSKPFEFTVVGIFIPNLDLSSENPLRIMNIRRHKELNNLIYVPIGIHQFMSDFYMETSYEEILFLLEDPLYLEKFNQAAMELLPDFFLIEDLTYAFEDISIIMNTMQIISFWIFYGVLSSSFLILGFIIILLLYDRRYELGVYLALGEKKRNLVWQFLIELGIISLFAITISLFIGHIIATQISQVILRQNLIYNNTPIATDMNVFNHMGWGIMMTAEEMLETYSVSLSVSNVLLFYGIAFIMVVVSTIMPMIYLLKLNPKKNVIDVLS